MRRGDRIVSSDEIDRIAHQRALQQKQQEEQARQDQGRQFVDHLQACVQEIGEETPILLRLLAERGYPNIVEVRVEEASPNLIARLFGGRSLAKGGWHIGGFEWYEHERSSGRVKVYLLSDGRIYADGWRTHAYSPQAILGLMHSAWGPAYILHAAREGISYSPLARRGSPGPADILHAAREGIRQLRRELEAR